MQRAFHGLLPGADTAVGYREIMRLREEARCRLGEGFDIREFHARVLEDGEITLPMLTGKIERWLSRAGALRPCPRTPTALLTTCEPRRDEREIGE